MNSVTSSPDLGSKMKAVLEPAAAQIVRLLGAYERPVTPVLKPSNL